MFQESLNNTTNSQRLKVPFNCIFSSDLPNRNNTIEIQLPRQLKNCYALKVWDFAMLDNGSPDVPVELLALRSTLSNYLNEKYVYVDTENTAQVQAQVDSTIIATSFNARRNIAAFNQSQGGPIDCSVKYFTNPVGLSSFQLNIDNLSRTLSPHGAKYILQGEIEFFFETY